MKIQEMNIHQRIARISEEVGAIQKNREAQLGNRVRKFRGLEDFLQAFSSPMAKYEVVLTTEVKEWTKEQGADFKGNANTQYCILFKMTFSCEKDSVSTDVLIQKNDYYDFAPSSALSLAISRAYETVFCVPTESPTPLTAPSPPPSTPEEVDLDSVIAAIKNASSTTELEEIYKAFPSLHQNPEFISQLKGRKAIITMPKHDQKTFNKPQTLKEY